MLVRPRRVKRFLVLFLFVMAVVLPALMGGGWSTTGPHMPSFLLLLLPLLFHRHGAVVVPVALVPVAAVPTSVRWWRRWRRHEPACRVALPVMEVGDQY